MKRSKRRAGLLIPNRLTVVLGAFEPVRNCVARHRWKTLSITAPEAEEEA
jgi:hypothetical protein